MLTSIIISIVLAFPFENSTPDRNLDWIVEGIAVQIIERLQTEPTLAVLTREERLAEQEKIGIPENAMVSRATAMKLGWDAGADFIITGRFSGSAENFQISARIIDMDTAGSSPEIKVSGKLEDIMPMLNSLSWQLVKKIAPNTSVPENDYVARPPTPRSAIENYIRGILAADPEKRIEHLQTAVRLHPQYPAATFQLGRTYHDERDFTNSSLWLEKVKASSPDYKHAQFMIGLNRYYLGDSQGAIAIFERLPQTYDVLINLGAAHSLNGDDVSALRTWQKAVSLEPLSSDAYFNSGYVHLLQNQNETAVRDLGESLKLRGRDSEALFLRGRAYERLGRLEDSQRATAQATRLSQRVERWLTQPIPRLERLRTSTSFRKAEEIWTEQRLNRRAKGQDVASWLEEIQTQIDAYQYGQAIRELQTLIRVYPGSTDARLLLEEVNARRSRQ